MLILNSKTKNLESLLSGDEFYLFIAHLLSIIMQAFHSVQAMARYARREVSCLSMTGRNLRYDLNLLLLCFCF